MSEAAAPLPERVPEFLTNRASCSDKPISMRQLSFLLVLVLGLAACSTYSGIPYAPPMGYVHADDALRRGNYAEAAQGFAGYLAAGGDRAYRARAYYQLAQAEYGLRNYHATLDALAELEHEFPEQRGTQTAALRGDAFYELGQPGEALLAWDTAWNRGTERDRSLLRARIQEAVDHMSDEDLRQVGDLLTTPEIAAMVAARLPGAPVPGRTVAAAEEKTPAGAEPAAAEAAPSFVPETERERQAEERAEAMAEPSPPSEQAGPSGPTGRIGLLLPLTGPDRTYGQRALQGLRLALLDAPSTLVVRDTGGDPEVAVDLFRQLAADPTVLAIIGPLRSSEAAVVAPLAEKAGIPVLLLSQREGFEGPFVLQAAVTQRGQTRALGQYAIRGLGLRRFGIIHPNDSYGRTFAERFREEIERQGGTVVGSSTYGVAQRGFSAQAAAVRSWVAGGGVDAVFVPDAAPTAAAVAAAVRSVAPQAVLLGTESWNQPVALAQAGSAVEGAVFADAFYVDRNDPDTQRFVEHFRQAHGAPPTVFEAQGYDSAMLLRRAMQKGAGTRAAVTRQLHAMDAYHGAGRLHATAAGLQPEIILLRVRGGEVEEVPPPSPTG